MAKDFSSSSIRKIEIVQDVQFGFDKEKIDLFISSIKSIENYFYVLHDKDKKKDGSGLRSPHYHLYLYFSSPYPVKQLLDIAFKVFGKFSKKMKIENSSSFEYVEVPVIQLQQLEKIKSRKISAVVAYCVHRNSPEKYQYSFDDVVSNLSTDELSKLSNSASSSSKLQEICFNIENGNYREYNIHDALSCYEYVRYKRDIEAAFKYVATLKKKEGNRNMKCLYFYGPSGTAKTSYAKQYCTDNGLSYYISSSGSDFLGDYLGQDAIILDDIRPDNFTSGIAELLKLCDNHTASSVRSRYANKVITDCKILIFTSVLTLNSFFELLKSRSFSTGNCAETLKQLYRRFICTMEFSDKKIKVYNYSKVNERFEFKCSFDNPFYGLIASEDDFDFNSLPGFSAPVASDDDFSGDWFTLPID